MGETKDVLCDSSALISLTDSCLDNILEFLTIKYKIRFIIPNSVEYETITRPLSSDLKQYAFSAIKIKKLINDGKLVKIQHDTTEKTEQILKLANNMLYTHGKPLNLMHRGEAEMLALASELQVKYILIDERTTRMLVEAPFKMKEHMEKEFGVNIMVNNENLRKLNDLTRGMQTIRSSELLILGYENGYMEKFGEIKESALEAALYKIKFSGCSISFDEVKEYFKSVKC